MTPAIELADVTVRYDDFVALDGVSFTVSTGEVVCLLGPNGAGKTTTINVCIGAVEPDEGKSVLLGYDTTDDDRELRRKFGIVPQDSTLYPELTGREHLELFASLYGLRRDSARIASLLELVGLEARARSLVKSYSGGMRRRLALARALLHDPPVLMLDEPTLGVDVYGRRALWDYVRTLRGEGRSILMTTNYFDEATALADRVVILNRGRVLSDASPAQLRAQAGFALVLDCESDPQSVATVLAVRPDVVDVEVHGTTLRAKLRSHADAPAVIAQATSMATVLGVRTEEPSLEEAFLEITGSVR